MNIEHKQLEFEHAEPGSIGLESCFGILNKLFPLDHVINFLTRGAGRFGIDAPNLEVGAAADITFFDPHQNFQFSAADIKSTSKNSAFLGQELQGKVIGSFNNGKLTIND
jgi:dihydroorotase